MGQHAGRASEEARQQGDAVLVLYKGKWNPFQKEEIKQSFT
jgi:hypothetical protein